MKHFTFDNHWDEIKGRLKVRYAQLADDDLTFVEGKADELLARLREKLSMSAEALDALLTEMHGEMSGIADTLKEKAGVACDQVRERARDLFGQGEQYVRENPRQSVVAALCAGIVAGLLIRR